MLRLNIVPSLRVLFFKDLFPITFHFWFRLKFLSDKYILFDFMVIVVLIYFLLFVLKFSFGLLGVIYL